MNQNEIKEAFEKWARPRHYDCDTKHERSPQVMDNPLNPYGDETTNHCFQSYKAARAESAKEIEELKAEISKLKYDLFHANLDSDVWQSASNARDVKLAAIAEKLNSEELVEKVAKTISGAPFPSSKSIGKARAAIAAIKQEIL